MPRLSFTYNNKYYEYTEDELYYYLEDDCPEDLKQLYKDRSEFIKEFKSCADLIKMNLEKGEQIDNVVTMAESYKTKLEKIEDDILDYKKSHNLDYSNDKSHPIDSAAPIREEQMKLICLNCGKIYPEDFKLEFDKDKFICPNCKQHTVQVRNIYEYNGDNLFDNAFELMRNRNFEESINEYIEAIEAYKKVDPYYDYSYDYSQIRIALSYQRIGLLYPSINDNKSSLQALNESITQWELLIDKGKVKEYQTNSVAEAYSLRADLINEFKLSEDIDFLNSPNSNELINYARNVIDDCISFIYYAKIFLNFEPPSLDDDLLKSYHNHEKEILWKYYLCSDIYIDLNELQNAENLYNEGLEFFNTCKYLTDKDIEDLKNAFYQIAKGIEQGNSISSNSTNLSYQSPPKKEGCYIATAVYGNYDAPQVLKLRKFRDDVLAKSFFGRIFIKTYYTLSPPLADKLKYHEKINKFVKSILDKFISKYL